MKYLNILMFALLCIGGLNWGLVGLLQLDLVATLFGAGTLVSNIVYVLVGVSAIYAICTWCKTCCCSNGACSTT